MREELVLDVTHRQVVFTLPKMLRVFFKYNRKLLSGLCLCGKQTLRKYLKATIGKEITPGIIAVIQSFGSKINLHPHLHFLVTEGGQDQDGHIHIAFIKDHKVKNNIIDHLKFRFQAERPPPPQVVQ